MMRNTSRICSCGACSENSALRAVRSTNRAWSHKTQPVVFMPSWSCGRIARRVFVLVSSIMRPVATATAQVAAMKCYSEIQVLFLGPAQKGKAMSSDRGHRLFTVMEDQRFPVQNRMSIVAATARVDALCGPRTCSPCSVYPFTIPAPQTHCIAEIAYSLTEDASP